MKARIGLPWFTVPEVLWLFHGSVYTRLLNLSDNFATKTTKLLTHPQIRPSSINRCGRFAHGKQLIFPGLQP